MLLLQSADRSRIATPIEGRSFSSNESTSHTDPQILRNSNSLNKPMTSQFSFLLKGVESLHEIKRKRDNRSASVENENVIVPSASLVEKKMAPTELSKSRKVDPAKAYGRLTRTTKVITTQKLFLHGRNKKEQQDGAAREKDKMRAWV